MSTSAGIPQLVLVSGLPGVGKTAVAAAVAQRTGAVHLSIDPVEDAMIGAGLEPGWTVGVAAYEAVGAVAELNLRLPRHVVVDAVNDSDPARDTWRAAASQAGARLCFVHLVCGDPDVHRARLEGRRRGLRYILEPTWAKVQDRAANYAPWTDRHQLIDTDGLPVAAVAQQILVQVSDAH